MSKSDNRQELNKEDLSLGDILLEYADYVPPPPPPEEPAVPLPTAHVSEEVVLEDTVGKRLAPEPSPEAHAPAPVPVLDQVPHHLQETPKGEDSPGTEGAPSPAPGTEGTPSPAPGTEPSPAPGTEGTPSPAPGTEGTPSPAPGTEGTPSPAPGTEGAPSPAPGTEGSPTPAPGTEGAPSPAPGTEGTPSPAPGTEGTPSPTPGNEGTPGPQAPPSPAFTQTTRPGTQTKPPPRKETAPPVRPPDAPPEKLAAEYAMGLSDLRIRCITCAVFSGLLILLALLESDTIPLLSGLLNPSILAPASLCLLILTSLFSYDLLRDGLTSLLTRKPTAATLALFATLFTLIDALTLLTWQLRTSSLSFCAPCALVLTFHLIGRYWKQSALYQASRTAATVSHPYLITQDPNVLGGQSSFRKWQSVPRGFGSQLRTPDKEDESTNRLALVLLVGCACLSLLTTVAHHQPRLIFWSLSALFCAGATLTSDLCTALPLRIIGPRLAKLGVAIAGWPGMVTAKSGRSILLQDFDIYPPGTISLASSRTFGSITMDRVVAITASMIRSSGSGLTYLFDKLLRAEGAGYLPITGLTLGESGLIGQCEGQRVLVGNSDFMTRMGVVIPPNIRVRNCVLCAIGAETVGLFVLKYNLHSSILPSLQSLTAHHIHPIVVTRDFNLSPRRLRAGSRLPVDEITFPDLQRRIQLSGPNQIHGRDLVAVLCREGIAPFSHAIVGARRLRRAAHLNGIFSRLGACIGVFLTASLSSAGALGAMSAFSLSLSLLLWLVPLLVVSLWVSQY